MHHRSFGLVIGGAIFSLALSAAALAQSDRNRSAPAAPGGSASLAVVASFQHQLTGVAVSETGRVFVSFPRWTEDAPISVAEIGKDGKASPYPNDEWNRWRNAAPLSAGDHFVCVQSVYADGRGSLWVIDPAAPNTEHIVANGPKLVKIDLATNQVVQILPFDKSVAPEGSYLNDVRISPDGGAAYMTDSGVVGALVVVDLATGRGRRVLDGDPSTQLDKAMKIIVDGRELRRPDGRKPSFAADGIALSKDGRHLYWQALTGNTLYRIPTTALRDEALASDKLALQVERVGTTEAVDGLWLDAQGRLYLTAFQENAIKVREPDGSMGILAQDERLRGPTHSPRVPTGRSM